ncbi:hypothetical protein SDRG_03131 [Saprolegnia diclina VS20]|uniref:Uncharacterized protein n=1 Tax=Saprolegnia diclina (strain VS20) TaxID=1156394 RepID=T0S3S1_SAPDV|nr:hypothetical protein SDRG_03131 [Saprolegnia diclina VS20]EQC39703.1 hypothetical protein SDRG_03131 [Saprolegnia diclina VS20]|eukprot:XP_008606975.1 hypothetical protein SDRG_03131 [Saprolegnia diclina VS20]
MVGFYVLWIIYTVVRYYVLWPRYRVARHVQWRQLPPEKRREAMKETRWYMRTQIPLCVRNASASVVVAIYGASTVLVFLVLGWFLVCSSLRSNEAHYVPFCVALAVSISFAALTVGEHLVTLPWFFALRDCPEVGRDYDGRLRYEATPLLSLSECLEA